MDTIKFFNIFMLILSKTKIKLNRTKKCRNDKEKNASKNFIKKLIPYLYISPSK